MLNVRWGNGTPTSTRDARACPGPRWATQRRQTTRLSEMFGACPCIFPRAPQRPRLMPPARRPRQRRALTAGRARRGELATPAGRAVVVPRAARARVRPRHHAAAHRRRAASAIWQRQRARPLLCSTRRAKRARASCEEAVASTLGLSPAGRVKLVGGRFSSQNASCMVDHKYCTTLHCSCANNEKIRLFVCTHPFRSRVPLTARACRCRARDMRGIARRSASRNQCRPRTSCRAPCCTWPDRQGQCAPTPLAPRRCHRGR